MRSATQGLVRTQKLNLPRALHRLCLFFISIAALLACTLLSPPAPQRPPLKFGYSLWPGYFPTVIAQEKGFFANQRVSVQTVYASSSKNLIPDLTSGKLDGMPIALGSLIGLLGGNSDLQVVAAIAQSNGADAVVAQPGIRRVADLKGKTLGVRFSGFGELFVARMLSMNGLSTNEIILQNVDAPDVPQALRSQRILAGHTWEPFVSPLLQDNFPVLFTSAKTPGLIPDIITFQRSVLQERPEDVQAFLRAWFEAVEFWQAHPQEGNAIIAKTLNLRPTEVSLKGLQLLNRRDSQKAMTPGNSTESLYYTSQLYVDHAVRAGNLSRPPDIQQLLDPTFLQSSPQVSRQ